MRTVGIFKDGCPVVNAIDANNPYLRLRGLIGRESGLSLLLTPCAQVHTFCMKVPLDLVYLDRDNTVLRIDENVKPGRMCKAVQSCRRVLELPAGTIEQYHIKENDRLEVRKHGRRGKDDK